MNNGLITVGTSSTIKDYILPVKIIAVEGNIENEQSLLSKKFLQTRKGFHFGCWKKRNRVGFRKGDSRRGSNSDLSWR